MYRNQLGRIRAVVESPDGLLYLLTDSSNGRVVQLAVD
ncbi:MAG: PQQ-dependent sugar dehydrogenase [Bacteroidota bacterium]